MAAPTPAFVSGRAGCVFIDGFDLSAFFQSFEFGQTKATIEANTFRSTAKRFVDDLPDSSISGEGFWDPQDRAIAPVLDKAIIGTVQSNVIWYPGNDTFGNTGYAGVAIITANTVSGATDAAVAVSVSGQPTGTGRELVKSLHKVQDETADGNSSAIDAGAASSLGAAAYLQVMEMDGTGTLVVTIETDTAVGFATPTTLFTFATVSATSGVITSTPYERVSNAVDTSIEQFVRAKWDLTTVTRVRFAVAFHRRAAVFS